jgi:SAM-dependent methyltransferase
MRALKAGWLALKEATSPRTLVREPEPSADMSAAENVRAFDAQGSNEGALIPVYHFNALNIHRLAPAHTTLVDLGSGSGRLLAYLARCRPDLTIVGIDLSEEMVSTGNAMLQAAGLASRVQLRVGDMTNFHGGLPDSVSVVSCIFALHHLPTFEMLVQCLRQVGLAHRERNAAVWTFDHARPKRRDTAERFPEVFTPDASPEFRADSRNSLIAAWTFEELRDEVQRNVASSARSSLARLLPLYQVHWVSRSNGGSGSGAWQEPLLTSAQQRDATQLQGLFHALPA